MTSITLAAAVRRHRIVSGLTMDKLAIASGISRSTLAKIEAGDTLDPGFSVVCRLLRASGATDEEFLQLARLAASPNRRRVIGVGYEGLDQVGLIELLHKQQVSIVADVRLTPLSRKPGMSKRSLGAALEAERIRYMHLPALGNPKDNRSGYSDPEAREPRQRFQKLLQSMQSREQLARVRELSYSGLVAVLCFEKDERFCHRQQVLEALDA